MKQVRLLGRMDRPLPQASAPPVARRNFLVDRSFQLKYAGTLAIIGAAISSIFGVLMILTEMEALRPLYASLPPQGIATLRHVELTQLWMTAITALLMAASLGLFGILITHRVAGPIYVLGRYVSVLARGRYPIMRPLRRRDELKAFFERFREAVESLRAREEEEARQLDAVLARVGDPANLATLATPAMQARIEEGRAALALLRTLRDRKRDVTERPSSK